MGFLDKVLNKNKTDKIDSKKVSLSMTNNIYVNDSFSYFGNGICSRPLEELDQINTLQ